MPVYNYEQKLWMPIYNYVQFSESRIILVFALLMLLSTHALKNGEQERKLNSK